MTSTSQPRPSQLLLPQREPVPTRDASTLLLLRDCADGNGFEVLMTRRADQGIFANAYVFPGGGLEDQDAAPANHALARVRPTMAEIAGTGRITQALAGIRETFEELGILLAYDQAGRPVPAAEVEQLDRKASLYEQCRARGWSLAVDQLWYLAHWTAPLNLAKRFNVPFFVARMPEGQTAVADETEQFEPTWIRPQQALQRFEEKELFILFPTQRTLQRLTGYADTQAVLDALQGEKPLWHAHPRAGYLKGQDTRQLETDTAYGELEMVHPDGQAAHHLDWQFEKAVPLRKNLMRLTAPNPGMMTGPGTNSYLVGDAHTGYIAIDPGPNDAEHLQRLHDAAGGDIRYIVCTHSHPDHSPGAAPLQAMVLLSGHASPPIMGLPSAPTARANSRFRPEVTLQDGERITLRGQGEEGEITHTLQAIFTPGHAANHLCFLLVEDALLFSGDHILNGSTTVISPPDGNMIDYLDSLDRLHSMCLEYDIRYILPAHGYVLGFAQHQITRLKAHRLAREAKVHQAMRTKPDGSIQDWVAIAYADTPQALWPVAQQSLLAHVERIQKLCLGR
ncbi:Hydroxyacylglutathione hydrolase [Comamonas sp. PE63]|uniref:Hydroxyacylglutathione hydrolase n=1 Tax=Comamonas brasiliensis TaxID=1812482 RepID=A0ABS5LS74_9BURK|nr:MBL fold metallo-hydrolase [Comamonas sp. PE63]MBS3019349.1 Hydroxyacylglutathione hydrolase [Comamonas sp. PE63]